MILMLTLFNLNPPKRREYKKKERQVSYQAQLRK